MISDAPIFLTSATAVGSVALRGGGFRPIVRRITRSAMSLMAARRRLTGCVRSKRSRRSSAAAAAAMASDLRGDF